jgi:hypothetical protein
MDRLTCILKCLCFLLICTCASIKSCYAQIDSIKQKRVLKTLAITAATTYTAGMIGLHQLWYKDAPRESFHFFNDNHEWKQMDKWGHFYSTFQLSHVTSKGLQHGLVNERKADLIGSLVGFGVMLPIEIFDGFSSTYGASTGDLIANASGSVFYLTQKYLWNDIRIHPKFSFHRSPYAAMRPTMLGEKFSSELLKDYNGQTYWLSIDVDSFIEFPKWLNIAVGYGAEGMVHARTTSNEQAGYGTPYRQLYVALDFDLSGFKSRSKFVNTLLFVGNMIKLPAPTLCFSHRGTTFLPFYF